MSTRSNAVAAPRSVSEPAADCGAGTKAANTQLVKANIETVYALRPVQKAMLLHRRSAASDPGFLTVTYTLTGALDAERYRRAWQQVVQRHSALRMSLRPLAGKDPRIVVWRELELPWQFLDWQALPASQQRQGIERLVVEEQQRGFDLKLAPALRVALVRTGEQCHQLVWSCHHLFLDGWSGALVVLETLARYRADAAISPSAPRQAPARPRLGYADYLGWLKRQSAEQAAAFWRGHFAGYGGLPALCLTPLEASPAAEPEGMDAVHELDLGVRLTALIEQLGADYQLTAGAVFQGAWALLLARLGGRDDVVFGVTVSGRNTHLDGMDELVGQFSNVVPRRVRLDREQTVVALLRALRDAQFELASFEHNSLAQLGEWLEPSGGSALFESLLVVQNLPVMENFPWAGPSSAADADPLVMSEFSSGITSTLPLTLVCTREATWRLRAEFDGQRFDAAAVAALLHDLRALLQDIAGQPLWSVAAISESQRWSLAAGDPTAPVAVAAVAVADVDAEGRHDAPRNSTELRLATLWEEVLGIRPLGVRQDFFALGGSSFMAVQLFDRMAREFGREIPLALLLQHPTIEALACAIDSSSASAAAWRSLVPIQASGARPPLVCVHAGGGHVLFYRGLARHLGPDQPVYGLQPLGLDGEQRPLESMEAMAQHYVTELQSVQPQGPYLLAGYCAGATVCLAMARELEARGQVVAQIIALDSGPPPLSGPAQGMVDSARRLRWNWGRGIRRRIHQRVVRPLQLRHGSPARIRERRMAAVEEAGWRAFQAYLPQPCRAPITLVRAQDSAAAEAKDFHLDWTHLGSSLTIEAAAVDHDTMMWGDEVATVAELVACAIDRALQPPPD